MLAHLRSPASALSFLLAAAELLAAMPQDAQAPAREECIVRLLDGQVLRGTTARTMPAAGGAVRLDTDGGAIDLEAEDVVSIRAVSELRREGEALRRGLPESPRRAHQMAAWLAQQGLYDEMARELDPVLEKDMGDPVATALLRGLDVERLVPLQDGDIAELGRAAIRAGEQALGHPTRLRLAELRLEFLSPDLYEPALGSALLSKKTGERVFAVGALARLMPREGLKRVLERALLDRQKDVRSAAQRALVQSSDPGIVFPLLRGLDSKQPQVRLNAIDALAALGDPRALGDLILRVTHAGGTGQRVNVSFTTQISYVADFDVEIAQAAAIADPVINVMQEGAILDVTLVGTHGETDYYVERSRALEALRRISGKDLGKDPKAWTEWWQTHQEEVTTAWLERRGFPLPTRNG